MIELDMISLQFPNHTNIVIIPIFTCNFSFIISCLLSLLYAASLVSSNSEMRISLILFSSALFFSCLHHSFHAFSDLLVFITTSAGGFKSDHFIFKEVSKRVWVQPVNITLSLGLYFKFGEKGCRGSVRFGWENLEGKATPSRDLMPEEPFVCMHQASRWPQRSILQHLLLAVYLGGIPLGRELNASRFPRLMYHCVTFQ